MCGFVGVTTDAADAPVDEKGLAALLGVLRHRGPDGRDVFRGPGVGLGACRLAVTGDARAAQPLHSADGRFVVAFNGEILGDAREHLRRLVEAAGRPVPAAEAGDGPLLVEGVAALAHGFGTLQGPHLLDLLEGSMGALVVLDLVADETWLVRDRLGIKPLHVARRGAAWWFASEIGPLLARFRELRQPDVDGLAELLHWQRPVRSLPFAGIETLGPGAAWRIRRGGRLTRWTGGQGIRDLVDRDALDLEASVGEVRTAFETSARAAADVDGPVSLFLSGGLDSGAVASLAGRRDLLCLTGRFAPPGSDLDESEGAARVAAAAGCEHEILDLEDGWLLADLPAVVRALEIPMAGPGSLALWRMATRAARHGRVVLTGTGGDELFGGYARTALVLGRAGPWTEGYEPLARRLDAVGPDLGMRHREVLDRSGDLRPLLHEDFLAAMPAAEVPGHIARYGVSPGDAVNELVLEEIEGTLPMLLHVEDRIAMAHGLEGRPVPCLGAVPRAAARVPPDGLVGPDGEGKRALRAAVEGRMPEVVRTDRRKRGFPTPFARAVKGQARREARNVIEDRRFAERGWWNVSACRAALTDERPVHDRALFALLSWEFWARAFLDGDAFGPETTA